MIAEKPSVAREYAKALDLKGEKKATTEMHEFLHFHVGTFLHLSASIYTLFCFVS